MLDRQLIQTFYEISNAVHTTSALDELYGKIHQSLASIIDATNFFIALFDKDSNTLSFPYYVDERSRMDRDFVYQIEENSASITVRIIRSGKPLLLNKDEILQYCKDMGSQPRGPVAEKWLGVPLVVQDSVIGVVAVQSYSDPNLYEETDVELLSSVSEQIALAIDKKQSEERLKERELLISTLYQISNAIHVSENPDQLYKWIHDALNHIIDARNFSIAIYDREQDILYFRYAVDEMEMNMEEPVENASKSSSLTYQVINSGKTLLLNESQKDELYQKLDGERIGQASAKTWLGVPLRGKHEVLGALVVQNYVVENCFNAKEVKLLESVCDQVAFAIERKRAESDLALTQQELIVKAHKAGMADIASDALHNIGNILNSVKTSNEFIYTTLRNSCTGGLNKALLLLKENADDLKGFICDDDNGERLMRYLLSIEKPLNVEINQIREQTIRIREKIRLMTNVIHAQLDYANGDYLEEKAPLATILDDTLEMHSDSLKQAGIEVMKDYGEVPPVLIQRVKLIHVLTNLIQNARDSILQADQPEKRILIELIRDAGQTVLKITDNGRGIESENLNRVFNLGFTTKQNGRGLGLHNCANFMTDMKGSIRVESKGLNQGATFILRFSGEQPVHSS